MAISSAYDPRTVPAVDTLTPDRIVPPVIRTETVLSRLPIHHLGKRGRLQIHITRRHPNGDLALHWDVSASDRYGPPRQLAYKLDTLIINRRLEEHGRPLPALLRLASLREMAHTLSLARNTNAVKKALLQNAAAFITAKLTYTGRDGRERRLEAGFTRYSVVFAGERLPTGQRAETVYLLLNDLYRDVLNHAPVRPLDYAYLKMLSPTAQRCYELVSYKIFAALMHGHPQATYHYGEYCTFAPQQRYQEYERVKKQMYKVHKPHLDAGYLRTVRFEATLASDGTRDWVMRYLPGPKACEEYDSFMRHQEARRAPGAAPPLAAAPDVPASALITPDPAPPVTRPAGPAVALVQYFSQRFHGTEGIVPSGKAVAQAEALIAQHGEAAARFVVDFAYQTVQETRYHPTHFGGILGYVPRALQVYAQRQARETMARANAHEAQRREQYETFRHQALVRLKDSLSPDDVATLKATVRARLQADGTTPAFALEALVRVEMDAALAERAGVPAFEAWQCGADHLPGPPMGQAGATICADNGERGRGAPEDC
jgi:hypothetical protein